MPLVKPKAQPDPIVSEFFKEMNKRRWSKVSATERAEMMSKIAKKRWAKMNKKQRSEYALKIGLAGNHKKAPARKKKAKTEKVALNA